MQGKQLKTPDNNYFSPIIDQSENAWQATLNQLKLSQEAWIEFLNRSEDSILAGNYPPNGMSYYDHIHGLIHHDAYHLGQMVLLAKLSRFR